VRVRVRGRDPLYSGRGDDRPKHPADADWAE